LVGLFGDEREELLLPFVVGAVRYPVQGKLMEDHVGPGLLDGDSIYADRELNFPRFGTGFALA
jgi:hypothetical protein